MSTSSTTPPVARPASTDLALKLIWTTIAVSVVGFLVGLATGDGSFEANGSTPELLGAALALGIVMFAAFAVVLPAVFAVFTGKGENWARIAYTVYTGLALLISVLGLFGADPLGLVFELVGIALGVGILVLLYRADSNAFFAGR